MRVTHLRCEHREDVPCVDTPVPRLGWALESDERDKRQTAYRILVSEHVEDLAAERGSLWDSGRIASSRSVDVPYRGRPLPHGREATWTVQVWDEAGVASAWAPPARFHTGLGEWSAEWIMLDPTEDPAIAEPTPTLDADPMLSVLEPVPYLRREFVVVGQVRRATLYATARGLVELELNGQRVGDAVLAPGWTDYRRRIQYAVHDVTTLVRAGDNVLGAILGEGWYAGFVGFTAKQRAAWYGDRAELLCELHVEYEDGSVNITGSDTGWRATRDGPIRYSDLLHGERYDARAELVGWSEPGYDDSRWRPVVATHRRSVRLVPERAQPMRVTGELRPVAITERLPGVYVFDLGQNMVGWARLVVDGPPGTRVQLRFAEMLEPDGCLHRANLRSARPEDTYLLRGGGPETWEPRFTFHGFRYVEATGLPGAPTEETLTGRVVHSDAPVTGTFACSDPMVEQLQRNITWSQRGNFVSVPTDCPQRDERLGWLADAQVFLPTATLNMDVAAFMTKWGDDLLDAQSPDGAYSDVAPRLVAERDGAPGWADAGIIVPWVLYRRYGDLRLLERHWPHMESFMAYVLRHNPDLLRTAHRHNDYGDWLAVGELTPKELLATAYWAYDAKLMAAMARALRRGEQSFYYERLRAGIVRAFNEAYVGPDGLVEGDTQTGYLLALGFDLLPTELRSQSARRLVDNLARHGWHLATGFLGVGLLCPVLTEAGYPDIAHRLLLQDRYPSWGYSIGHGATTIWERWDGWTEHGGFQTENMNSFNHYSLGSVGAWLYESVAGIRSDPERVAYEHVVIAPVPGELRFARASHRSVRGEISSEWRRSGDRFALTVTIPANVTATVVLPAGEGVPTESGGDARAAAGVKAVTRTGDRWVLEIGSGTYRLEARELAGHHPVDAADAVP